jgi:arylsulfatase A
MQSINRRDFMRYVGAVSSAALLPKTVSASNKKPNIILIMADDLGYECLGSYGSQSYKTPVLDKMAETGMKFDYCYSQPLCTPTRVQIMTGRYNFRNYFMFGYLELAEVTFGHALQTNGYSTCIAGKWQLGNGIEGPLHAGFDEYCLWQIYNSFAGKVVKGPRFAGPLIYQNSKVLKNTKDKYGPDIVSDYIVDFIERKKDQPFFVYYPMILTHSPFMPTPDSPEWATDRNQKDNKFFGDMVAYMDKIVGKIINKLEEQGLRENTLVMFIGDNGTNKSITSQFKGKKFKGGKGEMTDAGMHVPFIANWPTVVPAGKVNPNLIDFSDFFPTIMELTKTKIPKKLIIDGKSFLSQLKGEKATPREWIYSSYFGRDPHKVRRMVQDKKYKLYDDGSFYDIEADLLEKKPMDNRDITTHAAEIKSRFENVLQKLQRPSKQGQ